MGKIKDNLGINRKEVHTLEPSEVAFLRMQQSKFQAELDRIMQNMAADFLRYIAVNRFEYSPDMDLRFNFLPDKTENNLEIMVVDGESS